MRSKALSLLFGLVACLVLPGAANAWWNDDWSLRKPVTVDTGTTGGNLTEAIGRAPVLVRLHAGNFKFDAGKADGSDLRVIASDDKTPLKFEIETYDSLLGEAFVWIDVPDLKPGAQTSFYLYYGNRKASALPPGQAFDADTVLAWHFAERGLPPKDATAYGNNGQSVATTGEGSLIGPGLRLDGQGVVAIPASPSLAWTEGGALTLSAWIKPAQTSGVLFSRRDGGNGLIVGLDNGVPYVEVTRDGVAQRGTAGSPLPAGWHHLAVVAGAQVTLSVDGNALAAVTAAVPALSGPMSLGGDPNAAAPAAGYAGEVDEFEISKVARIPGFVRFAAASQGSDGAKTVKLGQDEETSSWSGGYFAVILHSVTLDGWVVIAILLIMAALSWVVMVDKARYLSRLERSNDRFRDAFAKVAADLTVLDKGHGGAADPALEQSSLYRVYRIAAEELRHRAASRTGRPRPLSAEALAAIRASLDSGLVRETQRLNRLMVLLTIAISGGPFLGLLGTVVGVMITFAAIAASGDVNVNAIAPGIAAALVATVAGLFVAIPALFGYNWLLSRIKNASADMQVFVDELLTKTAEAYRHRADQAAAGPAPGLAE